MRRGNMRLLESPIDNNLAIQLQDFSDNIGKNNKSPEKANDKGKTIKKHFELMKEEIKPTEDKHNDNNYYSNKTMFDNSKGKVNHLTFNSKNSNDELNLNSNNFNSNNNLNNLNSDQVFSGSQKTFDENFFYNHSEKANNSSNNNNNNNLTSKSPQQPGFFKRATILLKSAFNTIHEKEKEDFNFANKLNKKFIIKHIKSFQKFCVQEESKGDETSNFYFTQFLEIFLLHCGFFLFGIFIVPVYSLIYGPQLNRNLGFWGKRLISSRNAQYCNWIFLMITLAFSITIKNANNKGNEFNIPDDEFFKQDITLSIANGSIMFVFLRYLIVSIKYGFFPKKYYNDIKTKNLYRSNIKSNFLKYGWIEPDFSIINIYLKSAFKSNNTNYKNFYLECVGQIKENLVSKITDIENEIQKGNNKKRESYKRKIKKEKVSTIKVTKSSSKSLKKVSTTEDVKSNKELAQNFELNMKKKEESKNLKILEGLKVNLGIKKVDDSEIDKKAFENNKNKKVIFNDNNNSKKPNLNLRENGYFEDSEANDQDFKMRFFLNSFDEENTKNGFFDDILNKRNLNQSSETDDNKSKVSCESSDSSVGNLSFLEGQNNINKKTKTFEHNNLKDNKSLETEGDGVSTLSPALLKLKNFVNTNLREHIRKLKSFEIKKKESMQGKIEYVDKNVYKISGLYLSKMIMKKINNNIKFSNYKYFHIFLVFLLMVIPNVFIYKIFLLARPKETIEFINQSTDPIMNGTIPKFNSSFPMFNNSVFPIHPTNPIVNPNFNFSTFTVDNNKFNDSSNNKWEDNYSVSSNKTDGQNYIKDLKLLKFNKVSVFLLAFSVISGIIPVWVNTENLFYGLIDFERRRKIMEILYDIINPKNKDINYDLPILNITSQETIINWYHLRNIMMRYGKRFTDRIMIQTSVYGVYLVCSLIAMFITFMGNFGTLSILSLAVCFASNILIQFLIVLVMIKIGADFNYFEIRHHDLLKSNKIFIDNIYAELKYELSSDLYLKPDLNKKLGMRESVLGTQKKKEKNVFFEILKSKEYCETDDIGNLNSYHMDSIIIYNNICDKIRMDHILRPFRIFWIKSDYNILNQIATLISGGVFMYVKYIIKDFDKIFKIMKT